MSAAKEMQDRDDVSQLDPLLQLLRGQVEVMRKELKNLRSQIFGLRQTHEKDVSKIRSILGNSATTTTNNSSSSGTVAASTRDYRYRLAPVGHVRSGFRSRNGTPRQSSVCPTARGVVKMDGVGNPAECLDGVAEFSHVWILSMLDIGIGCSGDNESSSTFTKSKVAPPRCGGRRVGVFSTRSPHRPNPIGLTLARVEEVRGDEVVVSGHDLVDGTPVLDIKPYIPDYDRPRRMKKASQETPTTKEDHRTPSVLKKAEEDDDDDDEDDGEEEEEEDVKVPTWINSEQDNLRVSFTPRALDDLDSLVEEDPEDETSSSSKSDLRRSIEDILRADPRSVYRRQRCSDRLYFVEVEGVHCTVWFDGDLAEVLKIRKEL